MTSGRNKTWTATTEAYEAAEARARESELNLDVVLVGSDCIETVKVTHSNYFDGNAMFEPFAHSFREGQRNPYTRYPNSADPSRTQVAPSAIAIG